jgi:hypothetical protein
MSDRNENRELDMPFELNAAERMSPLWIKLSTEMEKRLNTLRSKNDNPNLSEAQTAAIRGTIRCYKTILGFGDEMPPTE